jgi:hypothetical protein
MFQCSVLPCLQSADSRSEANASLRASRKINKAKKCAWSRLDLYLYLYSSHQKYKQEAFLGDASTEQLARLFVLHFPSRYIHPQQIAGAPYCAETRLQVAKLAATQKPFDLYRPETGLGRVTQMFLEFLQICRKTLRVSVLPV